MKESTPSQVWKEIPPSRSFKKHETIHTWWETIQKFKVTRNSSSQVTCKNMKESTLMRNHSVAQSVTTNATNQVLWRPMKESTMAINHSAAPNVIINAQWKVIWKDIKKYTLNKSHSAFQRHPMAKNESRDKLKMKYTLIRIWRIA